MSTGKKRKKLSRYQKIIRTVRDFFLDLFRKIGRGVYFAVQYLKKQSPRTILIGIASVSVVLIAVIILLLASPKKGQP